MIVESIQRVTFNPTTEQDSIRKMEAMVDWYKIIESTVAVVFETRQQIVVDDLKGEQG